MRQCLVAREQILQIFGTRLVQTIVRQLDAFQALIVRQRGRNMLEAFVFDVAVAEIECLQHRALR